MSQIMYEKTMTVVPVFPDNIFRFRHQYISLISTSNNRYSRRVICFLPMARSIERVHLYLIGMNLV